VRKTEEPNLSQREKQTREREREREREKKKIYDDYYYSK
jgi:hypothetical protein